MIPFKDENSRILAPSMTCGHVVSLDTKNLFRFERPVNKHKYIVPEDIKMSDSVFNDLRLEGHFCDAFIKVEDVEFQIHRIILCKCSPYFLALFQRGSSPDNKVYVIPGMSPDMMRCIIEFAYTGSVSVTAENVQELLMAADQLNVRDVVQTCCDFLGERLRAENCIGIFRLTDVVFSAELQHRAFRYMVDHFQEAAHHEEFLQLPLQQLIDILDRDDLNVRNESVALEAVLRWIDHVPGERKAHVAVLLSKVRLALMTMAYMELKILPNELVNTSTECLTMARDALEAIRTSRPSHLSNPLARPRLPNAILLAIGGWNSTDTTNGIKAYDVRADYWINVPNNYKRPRASHGTAVLNGSLYCIGGTDRAEDFNSVRQFDLSKRVWHEAAPMYHRRCCVSVTVLGESIYALGGHDEHTRHRTAERYRPEANQWSLIAPMQEVRSDASSTTLHNKVYICGGFNGIECWQTAECYNPEANQWTMISPMNSRRSGLGIVAYAGCVYAVGGFDGTHRLCSAEVYDPENNSWREVSPMLTPRTHFGIEVLEDRLFVVGGFNGVTTFNKVESYDATADEWPQTCGMDISRRALSCCVVSGLPNMADYVVPRDSLPFLNEDTNSDSSTRS